MDSQNTRIASLARVREVLDYIDQGITVFDADLCLVVCNQRFLELMGYPGEMALPGTPFEDYLRYNVARGEYGAGDAEAQVRERLEIARRFEPHRFERVRPDGTVLAVVGRPLPRGGFVTTYTDVTDQRAAAEAVRRSRDELDQRVEQRTAELRRSERELAERTKALMVTLEHMTQGISQADADLKLKFCNRRFFELMEFPESMGEPGTPFEAFIRYNAERGEYGPGDIETQVAERVELACQMRAHRFERVRPDGTVLEIVGQPLRDGGFVTTYTDVTEQRHNNDRLRAILDSSPIGVVIWRLADLHIVYSNRGFAELTGRSVDELLGTTITSRHWSLQESGPLVERLQRGETVNSIEIRYLGPQGTHFWGLSYFERFQYQNEPCVLEWIYDFTELHDVRAKLVHLAQHDPLTDLANRRLLQEHLDRTLAQAKRRGALAGLLFLDLDGFKPLNDRHGHAFGDSVLKEIARRLQTCLRRSDLAARIGGDEFAMVIDDLQSRDAALAMGERLLAVLSRPLEQEGREVQLGASIGVVLNTLPESDAETLLRYADRAMYRAKREGRGRCVVFDPEIDTDSP